MRNGERMAADGKQISIAGRKFTYGLGVHSASEVAFNVNKAFQRFVADVGVDDEVGGGRGSVVFQVFGDGTKLFETVRMTQGMSARRVDLNITGVTMLKLVVGDAGDGIGSDHADWAGARLYRILDGTPPPEVTVPGAPGTLTAAAGNAKVTLAWRAATGATSYNVYRGTAAGAQAATPVAMGIGGTGYTDTGVANGTTYFYKVSGVNTGGIGARSNEASAKPAAVQPPGVPGNLAQKVIWAATDSPAGATISSAEPLLPVNLSAAAARSTRSPVGDRALRAAGPNFTPSSQNRTRYPLEGVPKAANPGLRASAIKGSFGRTNERARTGE